MIKKAIFPVGGLGARFLPATKSMPKEMLPLGVKPIIQHAYEEAKNAGIEQFIFITGKNKSAINNHFDFQHQIDGQSENSDESIELIKNWLPDPGNLIFIRQQIPLGLGHAVWCARNLIEKDEHFAVILADELFISKEGVLKSMISEFNGFNMVGIMEIPHNQTQRYGIVTTNDNNKITSMIEKPKHSNSNKAIVGRYILNSSIFNELETTQAGIGGEIQLTDAMSNLIKKEDFFAYNISEERLDCGTPDGYIESICKYTMHTNPNLMKNIIQNLVKKT